MDAEVTDDELYPGELRTRFDRKGRGKEAFYSACTVSGSVLSVRRIKNGKRWAMYKDGRVARMSEDDRRVPTCVSPYRAQLVLELYIEEFWFGPGSATR